VNSTFCPAVLLPTYKLADPFSRGLPWGAVGLPGCQIPPRHERPVWVAARWDALLHATLLWACREAAAYTRERGEAHRSEETECVDVLVGLPPLNAKSLVAFISAPAGVLQTARQNQRPERTTQCQRCSYSNTYTQSKAWKRVANTMIVSVVQERITQLELDIQNTRNNMRATFWFHQSALTMPF